MILSQLIQAMESSGTPGVSSRETDVDITSIHYRSDDVKPGGMFFAIKGHRLDGHQFICDAVSKGAVAVVVSDRNMDVSGAVVISVDNTKKAMAAVAAQFYNNPSKALTLIGITGTNGKTTTAYILEKILLSHGIDVGVISTINYRYHGQVFDNPLTTPESLDLQKILAEMVVKGVTHVVMEVSSHGVELGRISHCWFDVGIFTNLSQDHLDFHGNMTAYWSSKKKFFTDYLQTGPKKKYATAVINTDDEKGKALFDLLKTMNTVSVGSDTTNTLFPGLIQFNQSGMKGEIQVLNEKMVFQSSLIGRHNLENILCATGAGLAMKIPLAVIKKGIASCSFVPGRLERINGKSDRYVYIDYAHTPDALKHVLSTLKEIISGQLICVFGCGGDRDKDKRSQMGAIASSLSDFVIITSDNPRTESPDSIIEDIRKGAQSVSAIEYKLQKIQNGIKNKGFVIEPDREKGIKLGIGLSRPGDTILIAGKGHEDYQILGEKTIPFSDHEKAINAMIEIMDIN